MDKKILVVEDDKDIQELICEILKDQSYEVNEASDGMEGLQKYQEGDYDLIILDVMMPQLDGYQVASQIRKKDKKIPIIMLTALGEEYDQIKGFDQGIDDYITKPFSFNLLLKRVEAVLRRATGEEDIFVLGNLKVDFAGYKVTVNDEEIPLTTKEFEILSYLIKNRGKVLTREKLLDTIWGYDFFGDTRVIDTHIKNLRKKLDTDCIKTLKGVGYKFEG